jgi:periplasmic copper chaperone A
MRSLIVAAALALTITAAHAADTKPVAENGWSRATAAGQSVGAGFVTLRNPGDTADKLLSASSDVAGKVELHAHINDNGVMKMRPVPEIEVPAKGSVTLAPGGFHLMLIGLKAPLTEGQHVPLTLVFEKAGAVTTQLMVAGPGAKAAPAGHNHMH